VTHIPMQFKIRRIPMQSADQCPPKMAPMLLEPKRIMMLTHQSPWTVHKRLTCMCHKIELAFGIQVTRQENATSNSGIILMRRFSRSADGGDIRDQSKFGCRHAELPTDATDLRYMKLSIFSNIRKAASSKRSCLRQFLSSRASDSQ